MYSRKFNEKYTKHSKNTLGSGFVKIRSLHVRAVYYYYYYVYKPYKRIGLYL